MRSTVVAVGLLSLSALGSPELAAQTQRDLPGGREPGVLRAPVTRFDGTVILRSKDGSTRPLRIVIRNWIIDSRRQVADFPERGFMIVQLRGGDLTTTLDGKRQQRREDEFWTVRAGSTMSVETANESAVVQIVTVTDQK